MSQDNINSFYCNSGVYHFGVDGRGGTRYQDTRHSSSNNCGAGVDDEGGCGYKSQTSRSSSHFSGGSGRFLCLSFSSCYVDESFHEYERGGYSSHVSDKGDISCDDGSGRLNISRDDGDLRGVIRVDDGRCESRSIETRHFYSRNIGENVGGDWRGRYRSQTSHSSSHNLCGHGRLLRMLVIYGNDLFSISMK